MSQSDDLYRRWLDDEDEARRLEERRMEARHACERALASLDGGETRAHGAALGDVMRLEEAIERSLACYLGHAANDGKFLRRAFGDARARELEARLSKRKIALLTELDRVRELRSRLQRESPDHEGPGSA
jgi:hypothetical protein